MNYFTRQRYLALQERGDDAMHAADAAWDEAVQHYDAYVQSIRAEMPESVRELVDGFISARCPRAKHGTAGRHVRDLPATGCTAQRIAHSHLYPDRGAPR